MIELVVMALQCDITRMVSFMLDDARSDYVYTHVPVRIFNTPAAGSMSSPGKGTCGGYHGLQHAGDNNNGFATIAWWNAARRTRWPKRWPRSRKGAGIGAGQHRHPLRQRHARRQPRRPQLCRWCSWAAAAACSSRTRTSH